MDDAAAVLKFSLCCVIKMITGVANNIDWKKITNTLSH